MQTATFILYQSILFIMFIFHIPHLKLSSKLKVSLVWTPPEKTRGSPKSLGKNSIIQNYVTLGIEDSNKAAHVLHVSSHSKIFPQRFFGIPLNQISTIDSKFIVKYWLM